MVVNATRSVAQASDHNRSLMGLMYASAEEKEQAFIYKNGDLMRIRFVYLLAPFAIGSLWLAISSNFIGARNLLPLIATALAFLWVMSCRCKVCRVRYILRYINKHPEANWIQDIVHSKVCLNEDCPSRLQTSESKRTLKS